MKGRRVYPQDDGYLHMAEGDYGFDPKTNHWSVRPPGCHAGGIPLHQVTEHEDATITVSPSILLTDADEHGESIVWHGFLVKGEWQEV